jgi:chemotaxis protein MotB
MGGTKGAPTVAIEQQTDRRSCMVRRSALLLAAGTLALMLAGCATNRLSGLADDLRNAEVGAPVVVTQQDGSVILTSNADYMFPSGGWQIPSDSPVLNRMVPILSKLQNTKIVVTGYTDNTPVGPQLQSMGIANNADLSSKRAASVVNYLASHGVNPNLLSAQGMGDSNPVVSNDTPQGRARNRRVTITLTGDGT